MARLDKDTVKTPRPTAPRKVVQGFASKMVAGVVALSVAAMGLPAVSTSSAQADGYYGGGYYDHYYGHPGYYAPRRHHRAHKPRHHRPKHHHHHYKKDDDDEVAALIVGGIFGLAVGAIIANEAARSNGRANQYRSSATPPQRYYRTPSAQAANQWQVAPEPFTDEWYAYCANKYRSFDADTGTFQPYEGPRRLCR